MTVDLPLSVDFLKQTGLLRTDLAAVDSFRPSEDPAPGDGMELFWEVWKPTSCRVVSRDPPKVDLLDDLPPLPASLEGRLLDRLCELERGCTPVYKPDVDPLHDPDDPDAVFRFIVHAHLAAARAFALKRRDGYSDDARDCFERAWRSGYLVLASPRCYGDPAFVISLTAVNGLVLGELFRLRAADGDYAEALHFLANSLEFLLAARESGPLDESYNYDEYEEKRRSKLIEYLADLDLDAVVSQAQGAADHLLNHVRGADWKQVARDCGKLADIWDELIGEVQQPGDPNGAVVPWYAYWLRAQGRAEDRLNPSELRDLLNEREDEAAQGRLKAYFFQAGQWDALPERTRRGLIDADRTWFSTRAGRIESVLEDIKVATETLCYTLVWDPLRGFTGGKSLWEFVNIDAKLQELGHNPSLSDYVRVCKLTCFRDFLAAKPLSDDDRKFLTEKLPPALWNLNELRNSAEHDPARKWERESVAPVYREFIGIGRPGILPRLARIKALLAPSTKPFGMRKAE